MLHQGRKDIAAVRICNATRVRSYVTLSGVRAQMSEVVGLVCAEWLLDLQGLMAHLPESWLVSTDLARKWVVSGQAKHPGGA